MYTVLHICMYIYMISALILNMRVLGGAVTMYSNIHITPDNYTYIYRHACMHATMHPSIHKYIHKYVCTYINK